MPRSTSRKLGLKDLSGASRVDLEGLINRLVITNHVSAEVVNSELESIRETAGVRAWAALEIASRTLESKQQKVLLSTLKTRFKVNVERHKGMEWTKVLAKLAVSPEKIWSLNEMERTGGEPDVVGFDEKTEEYIFNDCSAESPWGRRNCVYDREAEEYYNKKRPMLFEEYMKYDSNAVNMAALMRIEILNEEGYRDLQTKGKFDRNTQSWLKTPIDKRKSGVSGVALFVRPDWNCDPIVDYAPARSHHGARAFRGSLRV